MRLRIYFLATLLIFCGVVFAAPECANGVRLLPESEREQLLAEFADYEPAPRRAALPAKVMNLEHLPLAASQGQLGICGSFQVYYYLATYARHRAQSNGPSARPSIAAAPEEVISPAWGVIAAPHGGVLKPAGADPAQAIQAILARGVLSWEQMPYSDAGDFYRYPPTVEQQKAALSSRAAYGIRLRDIKSEAGLLKLKRFLAEGNAGTAVIHPRIQRNVTLYPEPTEWVAAGDRSIGNINNEVLAWHSPLAEEADSHALTIIGYDDDKRYINRAGEECRGALLAVNSWGSDWGVSPAAGVERGYIWIGYEFFTSDIDMPDEILSLVFPASQPAEVLTGVLRLRDLTGEWATSVFGPAVPWLPSLKFQLNGMTLPSPAVFNRYAQGTNTGSPAFMDIVVDLSSVKELPLPELQITGSFSGTSSVVSVESLSVGEAVLPLGTADIAYGDIQRKLNAAFNHLQLVPDFLAELAPQCGSSAFGDANGDGAPDLALSFRQNTTGIAPGYLHRLYLNDGAGGFSTFTTLPLPAEAACQLIWLDWDHDGVQELVAGSPGGICLLENNGSGNFSCARTLPYSAGLDAMAAADFDGDGKIDLALAGKEEQGTVVLYATGGGNFAAGKISDYCAGTGTNQVWTQDASPYGAASLAVGDLNGDGLADIVLAGNNQPVIYFRNNGNRSFTPFRMPLPPQEHASLAIADCNNDGCGDLLYSGGDDIITNAVFLGQPNALPRALAMPGNSAALWGGRAIWLDLDHDGRREAVITGTAEPMPKRSTAQDISYPAYSPHNSKTAARVLSWAGDRLVDANLTLPGVVSFGDGASLIASADIDRDGDLDLLFGGLRSQKFFHDYWGGPSAAHSALFLFKGRAAQHAFGRTNPLSIPAAPSALAARQVGSGRVEFSWQGEPSLRCELCVGTSPGAINIAANLPVAGAPVILRALPAGQLYWRVRAVNSAGQKSAWSAPAVTSSAGSDILPAPGSPQAEAAWNTIAVNFVIEEGAPGAPAGSAYVLEGGMGGLTELLEAADGALMGFRAIPQPGWRFSHWEGPVESPLSPLTFYAVPADAPAELTIKPHFIRDHRGLMTSASHSALVDRQGNLWSWSAEPSPETTGQDYVPALDQLPAFAAASGVGWAALNHGLTYFGAFKSHWELGYPYESEVDALLQRGNIAVTDFTGKSYGNAYGCWAAENARLTYAPVAGEAALGKLELFSNAFVLDDPYSSGIASAAADETNAIRNGIARAAVSGSFALMLTNEGRLLAFGSNACGQLGTGNSADYGSVGAVNNLPRFREIAVGAVPDTAEGFALAIDFEGRVWSWGCNDFGQLGREGEGVTPQVIPGLSEVVSIAAGYSHALALTADGALYAWGDNRLGQCGCGEEDQVTSPRQIGSGFFAIAAAANHSLAYNHEDQLYAWGSNENGQLNGVESAGFTTPTWVEDAPCYQTAAPRVKIALRSAAVAPGTEAACNGMGTLSIEPGTYASRAGAQIAIRATDGERYRFLRWEGPVTEPNSAETAFLVGEEDIEICAVFEATVSEFNLSVTAPAAGGTIAPRPGEYTGDAGEIVAFAALPSPGYRFQRWISPVALGENQFEPRFDWEVSQDITITAEFAPAEFSAVPLPIAAPERVSLNNEGAIVYYDGDYRRTLRPEGIRFLDIVSDCDYISDVGGIALANNGRIYAWGDNSCGTKGSGSLAAPYPHHPGNWNIVVGPGMQPEFTDAVRILAAGYTRFAQNADGEWYYWGQNILTGAAEVRPQRLEGLPEGKELVSAAATERNGKGAFFFLFDDGTLYTLGDREYNGIGGYHSTMVRNPALQNVTEIAAGGGVAYALTSDGTLFSWGVAEADYGASLGLGPNVLAQPLPTRVMGNVAHIAIARQAIFALDRAGDLWVWGSNGSYSLGMGTSGIQYHYNKPLKHPDSAQLPPFTNFYCGGEFFCAQTADAQFYTWGINDNYQLRPTLNEWDFEKVSGDEWVPYEPSDFAPRDYTRVRVICDSAAAQLLTWQPGVYTLMRGQNVTLYADSQSGHQFVHWLKDGAVVSSDPRLSFTAAADCTVEAVYTSSIPLPQLALGSAAGNPGGIAELPLYLRNTAAAFEALDVVLDIPEGVEFIGCRRAETQLSENYRSYHWRDAASGNIRLMIVSEAESLTAEETPVAKLRFRLPMSNAASYTVALPAVSGLPVLSGEAGAAVLDAEGVDGTILIDESTQIAGAELTPGWHSLIPAAFGAASPDELLLMLSRQGVTADSVCWTWQESWQPAGENADAPVLIFVSEGGSFAGEWQSAEFTLRAGWNCVTVPVESAIPPNAAVVYRLLRDRCVRYTGERLEPGVCYWLYSNQE